MAVHYPPHNFAKIRLTTSCSRANAKAELHLHMKNCHIFGLGFWGKKNKIMWLNQKSKQPWHHGGWQRTPDQPMFTERWGLNFSPVKSVHGKEVPCQAGSEGAFIVLAPYCLAYFPGVSVAQMW